MAGPGPGATSAAGRDTISVFPCGGDPVLPDLPQHRRRVGARREGEAELEVRAVVVRPGFDLRLADREAERPPRPRRPDRAGGGQPVETRAGPLPSGRA